MEREEKIIREIGSYKFGDNCELIFRGYNGERLNFCNIICGFNCNIICKNKCLIDCEDNCTIDCEDNCNITCEKECKIGCRYNCKIICGSRCNIACGSNCEIICGNKCNIICGNDCEVDCQWGSYIKAGEKSIIDTPNFSRPKILKNEQFIWWYVRILRLINTYEDVGWKEENPDKWNEFYAFVHNELDSATLF